MASDDRLSHNPFAVLAQVAKEERRKAKEAKAEARRRAEAERAAREVARGTGPGGEALFEAEMAEVRRLERDNYVSRRKPPAAGGPTDDEEALAELNALVDGQASFELHWSDEHVEGIASGVDQRQLRELRKGAYSYQAHLDLHGKTRQEAQLMVRQFLHECRRNGLRCVLIIHGRGLNSEDQIPVLKEALARWLTRGQIGRRVLAFCSALASDGGLGAVYVLLRK